MDPQLRFGLSVLLGFVVWGLAAKYYFWPALRHRPLPEAFRPILLLHSTRYVGLAFLIPGVVSADLPPAFAMPAAYGDLIASLLAIACLAMLERGSALVPLWAFSIWGTGDLLLAYYQGVIGVGVDPGSLGAMYFVPTVVVPLLLVTHALGFAVLVGQRADGSDFATLRGAKKSNSLDPHRPCF